MGEDKVRSVKVKRGDGSVKIHSIVLLYLLELSLIRAHHLGTVLSWEAAGDEGVDKSDESWESPYADNNPNLVSQCL